MSGKQSTPNQLAALESEIASLKQQLKTEKVKPLLAKLAAQEGISADRQESFAESWANRFDTTGPKGKALVFLHDTGEPSTYTPQEALRLVIKKSEPFWFESAGKSTANNATSGDAKVMTRSVYEQTNHIKRAQFVRDGGRVVD